MAHQDFRTKPTSDMIFNILAVLFIIAIAALVWNPLRSSSTLLDNPYIAVLQFDRIGRDQAQDIRLDRINEDITMALSQKNGVLVKQLQPQDQERWHSRHRGIFSYKGPLGYVKKIAEEVGMRYVLTGKVHKNGANLRVTAQLIDAVTGDLLWMNRYTDGMGDFSSLNNTVADKIVDDIAVEFVSLNEECIGTRC